MHVVRVFVLSAIRYGRMPEAERKKLVAGLLAEELNLGKPGGSDLKTLAKQVNTAYLKNLSMTKKRARSILTGKTSSTSVRFNLTRAHLTCTTCFYRYELIWVEFMLLWHNNTNCQGTGSLLAGGLKCYIKETEAKPHVLFLFCRTYCSLMPHL